MNGYSIYLKTNGQYGIDRTLEGLHLYSVKGQWTTKEGAIKKVRKLYALEVQATIITYKQLKVTT